uniref:Insulin like growth factor binding protein 5 n=1 Tax=Calidris pygmaea TaxID=425635 RepID=A0A8C3JQD2_9CHAR
MLRWVSGPGCRMMWMSPPGGEGGGACGCRLPQLCLSLSCWHEQGPSPAAQSSSGVCVSENAVLQFVKIERESREHEEPTTSEMTEETYPPKAYRPKHGRLSDMKAEALKKDRRKKLTLAKFVGMAENTAHPRVVIPELRQEFELGPCRRHMEASLQELKSSQRMVPRAVHLPNCDRKGFYKRKQCKPSRGRKRGLCWCVDKYGMKLPGTDYLSGDLQCHAFDSSNVE